MASGQAPRKLKPKQPYNKQYRKHFKTRLTIKGISSPIQVTSFIDLEDIKTKLGFIEYEIDFIGICFELFYVNPEFNIKEIYEKCELINKICHDIGGEYGEFVEDRLINKTTPLAAFLRLGHLEKSEQIYPQLKERFRECRKELKKYSHRLRYERWLNQ